jgi:hypothetical protein
MACIGSKKLHHTLAMHAECILWIGTELSVVNVESQCMHSYS